MSEKVIYGGWSEIEQRWLGLNGDAAISPDMNLIQLAVNLANTGYGKGYWKAKVIGTDLGPVDLPVNSCICPVVRGKRVELANCPLLHREYRATDGSFATGPGPGIIELEYANKGEKRCT